MAHCPSRCVQGLPDQTDSSLEVERRMSSTTYRMQLGARLGVIRAYVALATAVDRVLTATAYMCGQPVVIV